MPTSGKLIRSSTGRLQRALDGSLKRCGCCTATSPPCTLVVAAHPCFQVFDEDCNRLLPETKWICVDAECEDGPVGHAVGRTLKIDGYCYRTDITDTRAFAKLTPEEQAAVVGGGFTCVADGCDDVDCGTPPDACECVCYGETDLDDDSDPDVGSFCCLGKTRVADGGAIVLCWGWTYFRRLTAEILFTPMRGGYPTEECGIPAGCNGNALNESCVYYQTEERSLPFPSDTDFCNHQCCYKQHRQYRDVIDKRFSSGPCPLPQCRIPNTATGTWAYVPDGAEGDGIAKLEVCSPVNTGTTTTVIPLSSDTSIDGCRVYTQRTVTETHTCAYSETTIVDEEWNRYNDDLCDEGGGPFICCHCQIYWKTTEVIRIDWSTPNSGDVECTQCRNKLAAEDD